MRLRRILVTTAVLAGFITGFEACTRTFNAAMYADMDSLYKAALNEYNAKRYDNSTKAFERLTTELPPRDARVPISFFYLGKSQEKTGDKLLAAKSYSRIYEQFPDDTLADDGLYLSGLAYQGIDPRKVGVNWRDYRESTREDSVKAAKADILLDEIAKREGIEALESEVDREVARLAERAGKSKDALRAQLLKEGDLATLASRIREEKTLDLVKSNASIELT